MRMKVMSLMMFIVSFFCVALLPLICLSILFSVKFKPYHNTWSLLLGRVMPWRLHEGGGEVAECNVCLCPIQQGETRQLPCRHVFHTSCLDSWLAIGNATCPLCRGIVSSPVVDMDGAELLCFSLWPDQRQDQDQGQDNWWLR